MIERECEICGNKFKTYQSKINKGLGKYCSLECSSKSQRNRIKVICGECGKEFEETPSRIRDGRGKYCSKKCMYSAHGEIVDRVCEICGTLFRTPKSRLKTGRGRFCSRACEGKHRSICFSGKNSHFWKGGKNIECICEWCGNIFMVWQHQIDHGEGRYCSRNCMYDGEMRGENHPRFNDWSSREPYGKDWSPELRRGVRERDNFTCQECGIIEKELGMRLCVHHIDYNKDNNIKDNLISLCRSCHNQTNFNRENWVKYYQDKLNGRD